MSQGALGGDAYVEGQKVDLDAAVATAEEVLAAIVRRHSGGIGRLKAYCWAVDHLEAHGWKWTADRRELVPPVPTGDSHG